MSSDPLMQHERGIILAADVETLDHVKRLVSVCAEFEEVVAVKVGFSLALRFGLKAVVDAVHAAHRIPVIYDHQKAGTDIPAMGRPFAEICREAGVNAVILFPHAGPKTLEAFVSAALEAELVPIVGLVMTHPAYLRSEGGYIDDEAPDSICRAALGLGVRNFVLPGTKIEVLVRYAHGPLAGVAGAAIMMPGIGSQGASLRTVFEAVKPCRRFAIIGSAIYGAQDPRIAAEAFAKEARQ